MLRMLLTVLSLSFVIPAAHAQIGAPEASKAMIVLLARDIRDESTGRNHKIPYRHAKAIEALFYHADWISQAVAAGSDYSVPASGGALNYSGSTRTLSYQSGSLQLSRRASEAVNTPVAELRKIEDEIFDQVLGSRGYQSQYLVENHPVTDDSGATKPREIKLTVAEKWADRGQFEGSKWEYLPVRLLSWPAQKLLYDIPAMVTSTASESVTRSPLHNIEGTADEFRGAGKLFLNGLKDMGLGILHPKRARFFDGTLELLDMSVKLGSAALGVLKSAVSVVAYPIYRLFGGKKSQRVPLKGKRAVIVLVDSGMWVGALNGMIDTYGESIVRAKLKSISDYYCITTNMEQNDIYRCIDQMPSKIQYLDIVSLQHSGGVDDAEKYARYAREHKGVRPELLLSIGCYDTPSAFVEGENALGQMKTSWAVHYYLANMLEKRLRGIPAQQAANQAFAEGFATNAVDPISWGAVIAIGAGMEEKFKDGYMGSQPNLITADSLVQANLARFDASIKSFKDPALQEQEKVAARSFFKKVRELLSDKKIQLKRKTLKKFAAAEKAYSV